MGAVSMYVHDLPLQVHSGSDDDEHDIHTTTTLSTLSSLPSEKEVAMASHSRPSRRRRRLPLLATFLVTSHQPFVVNAFQGLTVTAATASAADAIATATAASSETRSHRTPRWMLYKDFDHDTDDEPPLDLSKDNPTLRSDRDGHHDDNDDDDHGNNRFRRHRIFSTPQAQRLSPPQQDQIVHYLTAAGLWDDYALQDDGILFMAQDFVERPEVFSSLLMKDFEFPPLVAHQTRALAMAILLTNKVSNDQDTTCDEEKVRKESVQTPVAPLSAASVTNSNNQHEVNTTAAFDDKAYRSTVVNKRAQKRKRSSNDYEYGLPKDYQERYPKLANEMDEFYAWMTKPSTYSQEDPIRPFTANIYIRHAKLFLGWWVNHRGHDTNDNDSNRDGSGGLQVSIFEIIPDQTKESANTVIDFVLWLRSRDVSVSYEANLLRGIIKMLKFRFAKESLSDPRDGRNTYEDIAVIKECRKLHRDANRRVRLAPRSSDEQKKWIDWKDYLQVVRSSKMEVLELIEKYHNMPDSKRTMKRKGDQEYCPQARMVAESYQRYLILAFFASIPDRQRTIRELELGRTLVKDVETGLWMVKHGPDDYKTGKHYGERPAMHLAAELTPAIDDFVEHWRPSLNPTGNYLLTQPKTGKQMTADSIFQRVSRCCFKVTGKKVNPHLLRDIIVTHVRESDASEKELEALALFMGHSVQMQRSNYDRRTLDSKVAPAVQLMESVNRMVD